MWLLAHLRAGHSRATWIKVSPVTPSLCLGQNLSLLGSLSSAFFSLLLAPDPGVQNWIR